MTRTGPQRIPGASLAHFYGAGQYSGSDMEVNCGVVHTTEGRTLPTYADSRGNRGALAPTVTGVPDVAAKKIRWYQHYDVDESARALANKLGGVETNTANAFQMELVGTCDPKTRDAWVKAGHKQNVDFIFWPEAPDWALAEAAWLVRWLHDNHQVPLTCVKDWLAYGADPRRPGVTPASYGASPARMSFDEWRSFTGWCGHQHVPENDHGDPGAMDFARVIDLAKGTSTPQEDTMPTAEEIAKAVWDHQISNRFRPNPDGSARLIPARYYLEWNDQHFDATMTALAALDSPELTDAQVQAIAAKVAATPGLADAIAAKVAELIAERMAE